MTDHILFSTFFALEMALATNYHSPSFMVNYGFPIDVSPTPEGSSYILTTENDYMGGPYEVVLDSRTKSNRSNKVFFTNYNSFMNLIGDGTTIHWKACPYSLMFFQINYEPVGFITYVDTYLTTDTKFSKIIKNLLVKNTNEDSVNGFIDEHYADSAMVYYSLEPLN